MKHRLSSRILLPNLAIVIGAMLLLVIAMLISVRISMKQEAKNNFIKARATVELLLKVGEYKSNLESAVERINRVAPMLLIDAKVLKLTEDMRYSDSTQSQPFPESVLATVTMDDTIHEIGYGGSGYMATAIPYATDVGNWNLLLYTSYDRIDSLIRQLVFSMLAALAGASLVAAVASIYASRRIAGPLQKLSGWARRINGRQYGRYEQSSGTAEIDDLADSLNGMVRRLEDYDAAQKIFLQNASHELRTPLMSIQGYAEGIKHGVFSDTANAADIVVEESLRLSALVDDLLYMSKLETAEDFYRFEPTSLGEVLGQCAEKLKGAAIKEGKALTLLPCPDAPVSGDGEKLLRAVMNLAGNCLRYARTSVEMSVAETPGRAVVTVRDDGPGFDLQDLQNLFMRFYKGKQGKYGLGLSIAKTIVERHGGTIAAANRKGGGAEFTVELPRPEPPAGKK